MKIFEIKIMILLLCLSFSESMWAQNPLDQLSKEELRSYRSIRSHVRRTPSEVTSDPEKLGAYLQEGIDSDLEKVRSIYLWIANNITYDMRAFLKGRYEGQTIVRVLKEKEAVCEGYANLFSALCDRAGIVNAKILGYSKGYGYEPGQKFAVSNHAWNAVKLEDEWYLLDVTWGASGTNSPEFQAISGNLERYFLTEPHLFILDHLPEDPEWQLLDEPISMDDFETGKNIPDSGKKKTVEIKKDLYSREVEHYQRVIDHNPKSREAHFRLGYAYLSKALDTLEVIHALTPEDLFMNLEILETRIFDLLNQAEREFGLLSTNYSKYQKAQTLLQECSYQKGVFEYEAGYHILSLMVDMDRETYMDQAEPFAEQVNRYWDQAIEYFQKVPEGSLYKEQAERYIEYYIPEFRP